MGDCLGCSAGYTVSNSKCKANTCPNGQYEAGEVCDDNNSALNDGCDQECKVETGWTCSGFPSTCIELCSNGLLDSQETCDVGNNTDPGCIGCVKTPGYSCPGYPAPCSPICGDSQVIGTE